MWINLQDPELLRLIAIEEARERELAEEAKFYSKKMYVPDVQIEGGPGPELEDDDIAYALFSPRTQYEEKRGVVEMVYAQDTATEQRATLPLAVCKKKINLDRRLQGDGVVAPLPPSRGDPTVSGQMKIAIDVALLLKDVRPTDKVVVIGSSTAEGFSGESYQLLAGAVAEVDLYDPGEPSSYSETREGTVFRHHREPWPLNMRVEADVVFVDAYDSKLNRALSLEVSARVYSVKDARYPEASPYDKAFSVLYPGASQYVQLSATRERRWTNTDRSFRPYAGRLGTCSACREVDYRANYHFSPFQYDVWVSMHAYGVAKCAIATHVRPPVQTNISTLLWRTTVHPVILRPYDGKEVINLVDREDPPRLLKETTGFEWQGRVYVYQRGGEDDGDDDRPERGRFPQNVPLPRTAVALISMRGSYALENSEAKSLWALLVIDTYVYALSYVCGDLEQGRRERVQGTRTIIDYVYGPLVASNPIGAWKLYRFERQVATGQTPATLALRILLARRTQAYKNLAAKKLMFT